MIHLKKINLTGANTHHLSSEPVIVNDQSQFEVEQIMRKQIDNEKIYLQVKWKKYNDLTWEPLSDLSQDCSELVKTFMTKKLHRADCPDPAALTLNPLPRGHPTEESGDSSSRQFRTIDREVYKKNWAGSQVHAGARADAYGEEEQGGREKERGIEQEGCRPGGRGLVFR
ncbi:hypothetical protein PABG_11429 [Paracoccidioides brasiliensis Pb03]|nr:hypothetical protein PABG_11429 [Paracoccidioides brasiliensis Pb03]